MLTKFGIGNFKAFGKLQEIPLKPITLIYGANSAGKSSFIHGMILANHAMREGSINVHRTFLGGESIDLGGYQQYIHQNDFDRLLEWSIELNPAHFSKRLVELFRSSNTVSINLKFGLPKKEVTEKREGVHPETGKAYTYDVPTGQYTFDEEPDLFSYEILSDNLEVMQMSRRQEDRFRIDHLNLKHPVFQEYIKAIILSSTTTETVHPEDFEGLETIIGEILPLLSVRKGNFIPIQISESDLFDNYQQLLVPLSRGNRKEELAKAVQSFLPKVINEIIKGIAEELNRDVMKFKYLGPLRSLPPRHLAYSNAQDSNWYAGGGYAWDVILRNSNVRNQVNDWLSSKARLQTKYRLTVKNLVSLQDFEDDYLNLFNEAIDTYSFGDIDELEYDGDALRDEAPKIFNQLVAKEESYSNIHELILIDTSRNGTQVSHRDVGIGVSQVLPVLVNAMASKNDIIAIEQPEIHLHPALQADLGDVFINSALGDSNNTFVLESHSEHLLLRIMRRIRETTAGTLPEGIAPIKPSDVALLFAQPVGDATVIKNLELDDDGQLLDPWPGGFFEEGFRERFE